MDINPLIIIPTFWTRGESGRGSHERGIGTGESSGMAASTRRSRAESSTGGSTGSAAGGNGGSSGKSDALAAAAAHGFGAPFSHPTALDDPHPPLLDCLTALSGVQGLGRVALLVTTADPALEVRADERVREIAAAFPHMNLFVFGSTEAGSLYRRLEQLELGSMTEALAYKSYGAVRNLGLAVAAVLGSDAVVFLDDDEIVDQADFLQRATFGIGHAIHSGGYLFAKSGLVTDMQGNHYQSNNYGYGNRGQADATGHVSLAKGDRDRHWADVFWKQREAANKAVQLALRPPQMHRSTFAYGGCLAIHREMYTKIAFDPWITRGEDVDYVINARMHGGDVYIDDQWTVRHNSPEGDSGPAARFRQNVYRFIYEHRKLEFAKSQVDLAQISPQSLMPFPGDFIAASVRLRAFATGLLHTLSGPDRSQYWQTAVAALGKANDYARENCVNYFALQRVWAHTMGKLWRDVALHSLFTGERSVDRTALTGSFKAIG